jgi:hypothetical protein
MRRLSRLALINAENEMDKREAAMAAFAKSWRREGRRECVLINAQIRGPLSGANRKTFAHFETYRF